MEKALVPVCLLKVNSMQSLIGCLERGSTEWAWMLNFWFEILRLINEKIISNIWDKYKVINKQKWINTVNEVNKKIMYYIE